MEKFGIATSLYGPWLRANNKSFFQFLNNQGNLGKESSNTTTRELLEKTILRMMIQWAKKFKFSNKVQKAQLFLSKMLWYVLHMRDKWIKLRSQWWMQRKSYNNLGNLSSNYKQ